MAAANDPEAEAERERLAAVQRALTGENPYQDLLDQGINPAFFGVMAPTAELVVRAQFSDRTRPLHRRDGERRLSHLRTIAGQQRKTKRVQYAKSWQCETGTSAGELRAEPRAMRLVNHPFRLDSQRLLSYLTSMRVLTLAVTPAISTTFWNAIYFYTASATAGNLSYDFARGRHCTVSAAASRRHVDASLDLFTRKSPRRWRDLSEKKALSARRLFFVGGGSIN